MSPWAPIPGTETLKSYVTRLQFAFWRRFDHARRGPTRSVSTAALMAPGRPAAAQSAADLFDDTTVRYFHLVVHSADWNELRTTFQENTFYPADMRWTTVTGRNAAIRSRGRGSRNAKKPGLRASTRTTASSASWA